jgi:predicted TIM-barrel fold metal-dependent hydrolase
MRIIDTDTHIIETPDTWTSRLSDKWGEHVMTVRWSEERQREMWFFDKHPIAPAWLGTRPVGGMRRAADFEQIQAVDRSDAHPSTYDPVERAKLMDEWGIEMAVLYPNSAGINLERFVDFAGPECSNDHVSAYNDYQLEWCEKAPQRFIPMMALPYWDVDASVAEMRRLGESCFAGVIMTGVPQKHGAPSLRNAAWDPVWRTCEELGLSVSFHIATNLNPEWAPAELLASEGRDITEARISTREYLGNAGVAADLLLSGVLPRFPSLQFIIVESGMGWVPFVLESIDHRFKKNEVYKRHPEFGDLLPSDYFHRQVWINFWFEKLKPWQIDVIGIDHLLWETDYPHPTGIYADSIAATIDYALSEQPEDIRRTIMWDNPARLYERSLAAQGVPL